MQNTFTLFFYGYSKGSRGVVGTMGILLYLIGKLEETIAWGLGESKNKQAKTYALL
jgi:hypothetical protein